MARLHNISEIVNKVKKKKRETVLQVFAKRIRENTLVPGAAVYKFQVGVKLGWRKLIVHEWGKTFENYVPVVDGKSRLEFDNESASILANNLKGELKQCGVSSMMQPC